MWVSKYFHKKHFYSKDFDRKVSKLQNIFLMKWFVEFGMRKYFRLCQPNINYKNLRKKVFKKKKAFDTQSTLINIINITGTVICIKTWQSKIIFLAERTTSVISMIYILQDKY